MATIDNLSIQVTASAESAASALDRLASSAGGLRGAATRAGGGLRDLSAGAKDAGTATQEAGQQAGNAEKHTRNYGRAAEEAGKAAKRGTAGIATFWQALKRIAYYRFIRTIIKEITSAFSEGIKNIYTWSSAVNGHFAKSMNQLATATNYLKNSLGAMTAPLLEALAPAIDFVIDKVVALLNVFNQFFAALSGSSTYTVAKKVAVSWGGAASSVSSSANNANDSIEELKRTILGFDEINKLDKFKTPGSSGGSGSSGGGGGGSSGGGIAFEEKPLEGFFKDLSDLTSGWPDWLKWLFGIGAVAIGAWGISQLPKLIGAIWDALKNLFSIVIPDWFRWLFGPKGDGNVDIDIPDHIDIPDGKIKVDVEKGDWSALDDLKNKDVKITPKLDNTGTALWNTLKKEWDASRTPLYASPKLDNTGTVLWNGFKKEWDAAGSKVLYFSPKLDNTAKTLYDAFKKTWDDLGSKALYFSPKLDNTAKTLYDGFITAWNEAGSKILYFSPKLDNQGAVLWEVFKTEWENARVPLYATPKLDNTGKVLWDGLKGEWDAVESHTLYASPKLDNTGKVLWDGLKGEWDAVKSHTLYASPKLDNTGSALWTTLKDEWGHNAKGEETTRTLYASPKLDNTGSALWTTLKNEWNAVKSLTLYASPKLDNTGATLWKGFKKSWNDVKSHTLYASPKLNNTGSALWRTFKKSWDDVKSHSLYASPKLDNTGSALWRAFKKQWDDSKSDLKANVKVTESSSGGSVGGGGSTSGGGAGRERHANGGILSNGIWSNIPQYGTGSFNALGGHGTMFIAGEAGPEIVGHIGGRTEILNRSQLAATMYSAVRSAMSGVQIAATMYSGSIGNDEADYEMMYRAMYDAFTTAMAGSDAREQEKMALIRRIAEKEFTTEVTASSVNRAQTRQNRRAGTTIIPVGT